MFSSSRAAACDLDSLRLSDNKSFLIQFVASVVNACILYRSIMIENREREREWCVKNV